MAGQKEEEERKEEEEEEDEGNLLGERNPLDPITFHRLEEQRRAYYFRRMYFAAGGALMCMGITMAIVATVDIDKIVEDRKRKKAAAAASAAAEAAAAGAAVERRDGWGGETGHTGSQVVAVRSAMNDASSMNGGSNGSNNSSSNGGAGLHQPNKDGSPSAASSGWRRLFSVGDEGMSLFFFFNIFRIGEERGREARHLSLLRACILSS